MSGLAHLLLARGIGVSGSDSKACALTTALAEAGARIAIGHARENVGDADVVAYSTAVKVDNPEIVAARERGVPIWHRSELLRFLVSGYEGIAIAGTHGKTTTAAMLGCVLVAAGLDPLVVVGGEVPGLGGNARHGAGRYAVYEADESDRSFHNLEPTHAVVTNIESDHLDQYEDHAAIVAAFERFVERLPRRGRCVLCIDDPHARSLITHAAEPVTYGIATPAEFRGSAVRVTADATRFRATGPGGADLGEFSTPFPGVVYAVNSLATLASAVSIGVEPGIVRAALAGFSGTARRFERMGAFRGAEVVDDYAHHPTEVRATIAAAREVASGRVIVVFQPHLYSRTHFLRDGFVEALGQADLVLLTEIYGAREDPSAAPITGAQLTADAVARWGNDRVLFVERKEDIADLLAGLVRPGDLILVMGAGDIREVSEQLAQSEDGTGGG
jgi:UDP-N-acetylmuramate--alanine ligase